MLSNRINPLVYFGIMIMALPIFLSAILFDDLRRDDYILAPVEVWHIQVLVTIIFSFVTSLSLLLRWKYARSLTNILLLFISIIYGIFFYAETKDFHPRHLIVISMSLFIYAIILFCFLFINSDFIRPFFNLKTFVKERAEDLHDILDA